ncbi:ribonuclease H-like domain-containing protein [Tanacetum coccineum]
MTPSSPPSYTFLDATPPLLLNPAKLSPIVNPTPDNHTATTLFPSPNLSWPKAPSPLTLPSNPKPKLLPYDIILTASSTTLLQHLIDSLHHEFDKTDLKAHKYFLGIFVVLNVYRALWILVFTYMHSSPPLWLVRLMLIGRVSHLHPGLPQIHNLLRELHSPLSTVTLIYYDNVSAIYMSANPIQHQRIKHIEIVIHFVRDMVSAGQVRVLHVSSCYQFADVFTDGLPSALFEEFRFSNGETSRLSLR